MVRVKSSTVQFVRNASLCTLLIFVNPCRSFTLMQVRSLPSSLSSFLNDESSSLSDLVSSPERHAVALNMTLEEITRIKSEYSERSERLDRIIRDPTTSLSGVEKHTAICRHRHQYGRQPFTCPNCWSYLPVCICGTVTSKRALPKGVSVVVWTHHREWGLTSNTGCILPLTLRNCIMLMKGLPEHDNQLRDVVESEDGLQVVLWPDTNKQDGSAPAITLEEVTSQLQDGKDVALIVVDGTWRNARKMVTKLPSSVRRLDLSANIVFGEGQEDNDSSKQSILAPLRSKGPNSAQRQVCTAEAVVGALRQLGLNENDGEHVLEATRLKVDYVRRYRGKSLQ